MSLVENILPGLMKKVVISFPSEGNMWAFFERSIVEEFRLDSSKHTITGRFVSADIERAQQMNGVVEKIN